MSRQAKIRLDPTGRYVMGRMPLANEAVTVATSLIEKHFTPDLQRKGPIETPLDWAKHHKAIAPIFSLEVQTYLEEAIMKSYADPGQGFAEDLNEALRSRGVTDSASVIVWYWILGHIDFIGGFEFQENTAY